LFFVGSDSVHGQELWKSDGSAAGTTLVKDLNVNPVEEISSYPHRLTPVGGTLFFVADDGVHGFELWKSDGTAAGTTLVKDIIPADRRATPPGPLTAVGNTLFFRADDGVHGAELWTSDGTPGGTALVQDLNPGAASADPSDFTRIGTTVFFSAQTPTTGMELWAMNYYQVYLPLTHR
jgi:ELWxxDGT repeat protein